MVPNIIAGIVVNDDKYASDEFVSKLSLITNA
jgi:hypothetical protein